MDGANDGFASEPHGLCKNKAKGAAGRNLNCSPIVHELRVGPALMECLLMWIVLLLIGAFVVWHFIPQPDPNRPAPRFRRETRAVESDPGWVSVIEAQCESPAETAFLRAMIKACNLKPNDGSLVGAGVRLDFQVTEGRYRVDFLVNKWLVVEIDGAAWHSLPEAVARDKVRDQYFERFGYTVLRIPAKVVFNQPNEAVQRVQVALQKGKRTMPIQKSGWQRLSETASAFKTGLSEINAALDQARMVESAMRNAKLAAGTERRAIIAAISIAQGELETADLLAGLDKETKRLFEESQKSIMGAFADSRGAQQEGHAAKIEAKAFPTAPPLHDNLEHRAAIQAAYSRVAEERTKFLVAQGMIANSDPRMPPIVEKQLNELGCGEYWELLRNKGVRHAARR